jgi:hypothetical protein
MRDQQGLYLHTVQHKNRINVHNTDIHALSGIRASEDSSCLRPRGHCDRHKRDCLVFIYTLWRVFSIIFGWCFWKGCFCSECLIGLSDEICSQWAEWNLWKIELSLQETGNHKKRLETLESFQKVSLYLISFSAGREDRMTWISQFPQDNLQFCHGLHPLH